MFGWFKKRAPTSELDKLIVAMYGDPPPQKTAVLDAAIQLAYEELLDGNVEEEEVREVAAALDSGPIPYSTQDLALSSALNFFKQSDRQADLQHAQLSARLTALEWAAEGKVCPMLLQAFEGTLYRLYQP